MEPRHVEFRKGRPGIERLELRIAPAIVAVNGGGNTPNGEATETQDVSGYTTVSQDALGVHVRTFTNLAPAGSR
jgi:hypothetical protein